MKKIITLSCFSGIAFFIFLLGGSNISCNKPTDCKAVITIVDSNNVPVSGALVKLYSSNPPGQVQQTGTTGSGGTISFDFKLPAIFDISAAKTVTSPPKTMVGTGIIQLQIGQTVNATVSIR